MYVRPRPRFRPRNAGSGNTPSLALEFNQLSALPSYVTFSRGTQAMQYGSDGTLQYAPNNLLTYSNQADNAAWTKSNSFVQTNLLTFSDSAVANYVTISGTVVNTTPITGFTNSVRFPDNSSTIFAYKSYTVTASTVYTMSAYVQMDDGTAPVLSTSSLSGDLTLVVNNDPAGATNPTVVAVGGGVYRVYVNYTTAAFSGVNIGVAKYNTQSVKGFKVTGLQLVQGSVPGNYQATTSAALPVLYADYTGALRARKLCEGTTTSAHFAFQGGTGAGQWTLSEYFKAGERTRVALGNSFAGDYAVFDLSAGTVVSAGSGTVSNGTITSAGNGYYRCAVLCTPVGAWNPAFVTVSTGTTTSYTGDGSSGIYIADAQLTPGYLPLAVTETTSAAVYGPRFDYDPSSLVTQNLLLYSEQFDNAVWTKTAFGAGVAAVVTANQGTAPDGTLTADRVDFNCGGNTSSDRSLISQGYLGTTVGLTYTETVYIKAFDAASIGKTIRYTIETGASTNQVIITLTSDWQRVTNTFASAGATYGIVIETRGTVTSSTTASVLVWGAQLNRGSTALPYTATTTAPYTLTTARGLLIEEQRANLLLQSNDFQTSWLLTNITRTLANTTSPEGVLNGVKIEATATAGAFATQLRQSAVVAATSATGSVYVKQGTSATKANEFLIRNSTTATDLIAGTLNYSTGVFTYTTGSTGVVVTNVGNGWWRISVTATAGITAGDAILWYVGWVGAAATAGDFLYAYGAQLEAGAFATSYIPTVASTATRNADSASITTLTPWFNAAAGTLYGEYDQYAPLSGAAFGIAILNDGSANNRFYLFIGGGTAQPSLLVTSGGVAQASISNSAISANVVAKTAGTYALNDFAVVTNAGTVATDLLGSLPVGLNKLELGSFSGGTFLNGHIRSIRYYPTRLPNASLQSITV